MAVMQAAPSLRHSSSPPVKQTATSYSRGKPLFSAPRKRSVGRHSQMVYPGEDAPGTGVQAAERLPAHPCWTNSVQEQVSMHSLASACTSWLQLLEIGHSRQH